MAHRPRVVARETLYEGPFRMLVDEIEDGPHRYRRAWVQHPGAVVIIPLIEGDVLLVRQFRHPTGERLLELPAGTLEPGEEPRATAERELQEECGYRPGRLREIFTGYAAPGYSSEVYRFFLAEDLTPSRLPGDVDEDIELVRLPLPKAVELARAGRLGDVKTALGLPLL